MVVPCALAASVLIKAHHSSIPDDYEGSSSRGVVCSNMLSTDVVASHCGMQAGFFCPERSVTPTAQACPAGYACPTGASDGTALPCGMGTYSFSGAGLCSNCTLGRFGSGLAATSSLCAGACTAGHYCPAGSVNATAVVCSPGQYCGTGAGAPQACAPGFFGNVSGLGTAQCSGVCPPGYFCEGAPQNRPPSQTATNPCCFCSCTGLPFATTAQPH
jgi:hypothetical protein